MKKQLIIAIAAGAAVLCYFVIRNKYREANNRSEAETQIPGEINAGKHHLTDAFANAKKHVMHATQNA